MTEPRFPTSKAAKAAGWHSRRHETREAQDEARERYQSRRGPNVRRGRRLQKSLRTFRAKRRELHDD